MKKIFSLFLLLTFVLCFSACTFGIELPDTVTIAEAEYKKAFSGDLYPTDEGFLCADGVKITQNTYHKYSDTPFDCYLSYDDNAEPTVYFKSEQFDEAVSYYQNASNFNYFCVLGNIHDENDRQVMEFPKIDTGKFDSLLAFSQKYSYDPLASNNEDGLKKVPLTDPDHHTAEEIHFYKESKDGAFVTLKAYTLVLHEGKLHLLYRYYFSDEADSVMLIRAIPTELDDYFRPLIADLQKGA